MPFEARVHGMDGAGHRLGARESSGQWAPRDGGGNADGAAQWISAKARGASERRCVRVLRTQMLSFTGGPAAWRGRVSRPPVVAAPRSCQSSSEPSKTARPT